MEYSSGEIDDQGDSESRDNGDRHDLTEMLDDPWKSVDARGVENVGEDESGVP